MEEEEEEEDIETALSKIITITFKELVAIYGSHKEKEKEKENKDTIKVEPKSRLIFPCYGNHRNNEVRVSEQELRFAFVEAFYEYCSTENHLELFYSVETPTRYRYNFANKDNPCSCDNDKCNRYKSGSFDLVIHDDNMKRVAYIEFKANNPTKGHLKDFCKLKKDPDDEGVNSLRYFIEIVTAYNGKTKKSLKGKFKDAGDKVKCIVLYISNEPTTSKILEYKYENKGGQLKTILEYKYENKEGQLEKI